MNLRGILPFAHDTLRKVVRPGDYVIDATCGNGHDTLLLAELVGINGHVLGFDIQQILDIYQVATKKLQQPLIRR